MLRHRFASCRLNGRSYRRGANGTSFLPSFLPTVSAQLRTPVELRRKEGKEGKKIFYIHIPQCLCGSHEIYFFPTGPGRNNFFPRFRISSGPNSVLGVEESFRLAPARLQPLGVDLTAIKQGLDVRVSLVPLHVLELVRDL